MSLRQHSRKASFIAVAAAGLLVATLAGQSARATTSSAHQSGRGGPMYDLAVRATTADSAGLAQRLDGLGFDVTARIGATVHVLGGAATQRALGRLPGVEVTGRVLAAPLGPIPPAPQNQNDILPRKLHGKHYQTFYGGYRTVAAFHSFESDLQTAYPTLVKKVTYGQSYTGKNPLTAVCVTADASNSCQLDPDVSKARFLLMAQTHAREIATSEMAWRYITEMVDGWNHDAQITSLLKSSEIWVIPQVNPDGIETVQRGIKQDGTGTNSRAWQRKNWDRDDTPTGGCGGTWAYSQPGVDVNRNFNWQWGGQGTSQNPCDQQYLGEAPDSETEASSIESLMTSLFKDQRKPDEGAAAPKSTTGMYVSLHSDAGLVLIPWSYDNTVQTPNDAQLRSVAFRQSYFNGYVTGQWGDVMYNAAGTTDDWIYGTLGIGSFTWELNGPGSCTGFLPVYSCMDDYATNNLPGLVYDAAVARTPYKLSFGPTVLAVTAAPSGGSATVTATADDDAYGATGDGRPPVQNVTAGRIFVGTSPWDGGTSQPMSVQGSGSSVTLKATVDLGAQRVLAYVQGRDADGDWGPVMAVWIPAAG